MVENVANEFRVVWGVYWCILLENYKLKGELRKNPKWLASSFSIFCKCSWSCFEHSNFSTNGYIYVGATLALLACHFSHTFNWNQCEFCMHKGCIEDAGSLMLYCCILFFICLTIFSGTLLKWKHFIAKINLCCYFLSALTVEK